MLKRYLTVTPPVVVKSPLDDTPTDLVVPWPDAMRNLFRDQRLTQQLDVFSLIDLRKKLIGAKEGDVVELTDEEWTALVAVLRQPLVFSPDFIHSAEDFFRAFIEAPTKAPVGH